MSGQGSVPWVRRLRLLRDGFDDFAVDRPRTFALAVGLGLAWGGVPCALRVPAIAELAWADPWRVVGGVAALVFGVGYTAALLASRSVARAVAAGPEPGAAPTLAEDPEDRRRLLEKEFGGPSPLSVVGRAVRADEGEGEPPPRSGGKGRAF